MGLDQQNGTLGPAGGTTVIAKGFNPTNPHRGSAVVATFLWTGPDGLITTVTDRLANGRRIGNTYRLVERATSGQLSMATYVATNVQGFPDPCCSLASNGQDSVHVVEAFLSQPITEGGVIISAYSGVDTAFAAALGAHRSDSGSASTTTTVSPGALAADSGALVYDVAIATPVVGHSPSGPPFQLVGSGSSPMVEADAQWAVPATAGSFTPQWSWFFRADAPGSWLASGVVLNPLGNAPPPPPPAATRLAFRGQPSGATAGAAISPAVQVAAQDDAGTTVTSFTGTVTVAIGTNPGGGTLSGTTSVAAVNGVATFSTLSIDKAGTGYTLTAASSGLTGATSGAFNVTAGPVSASQSSLTVSPTTITAGSGSSTITVAARDANANPIAGATVVLSATGSGNTLTQPAGPTNATGVATGALSSTVAESKTVSATINGVAMTQTATVTVTAGTGDLIVTASTSGSSVDPDGYSIAVDGGAPRAMGINGSVSFPGLASGDHSVALSGVAANCTVSGSNPRSITVPSGETATTTFGVTCSATTGDLTVTTGTTGSSLDPDGYTVAVDGGAPQPIGINASTTFPGLVAGDHSVTLSGVANNCTVSGSNPRTVTVPSGGTANTTFSVSCTTPPGNLTVTTSTGGSSLDPDGYAVTVDGGNARAIGTNASTTYSSLPAGSHSVAISGVASNCTVSGGNPRSVSVPSGGTANTTFSVTCTTPNQAPVVNAGPDQTALTGLLYTLSWSFSDPDNGPWSFTIDWGDGSKTTGSKSSPGSFTAGHTYVTILPRNYTIRVTVVDSRGASGSDTKVVTVLLL